MEKARKPLHTAVFLVLAGVLLVFGVGLGLMKKVPWFDQDIIANSNAMLLEGRQTFRYDTFGDETFWGDTLQLHQAIQGEAFGGVGPGVSPATALAVGLKVDVDALPRKLVQKLIKGQIDLNDPAVTLQLLKLNAVVGVTGIFNDDGSLSSMGIQCAFCHSTVDNSLTYGIGHRLDGWANRDLNVGAIVALSPNLQPIADLLGVDVPTVLTVLNSWGPGKYDAVLFLDGKAFNPEQITDGVVTGTNVPGAVLIPNAFDLAGHNNHTWEGAWGSVPYWNAFVGVLEMHGIGNFYDPRLDDADKYPIAAAHGFGHIVVDPELDRVTGKLPALQFYQLAIPAPEPVAGVDYDAEAAERGDELFSGQANCTACHSDPLWTEPGWNLHAAADIGIDSFQADRGPDNVYRTMNLSGLYIRENAVAMDPAHQGRYYHDGRFATLRDVVNHYNVHFSLGLSEDQITDLVEYLKSIDE